MSQKSSETSKSILRNVLFNFSTWFLPLGLSFFATPIIVRSLGDEDYGIFALVLGFVGYSLNFGIGRAITKYISEYRASGEVEKIKEVISATFFLNAGVGLAGVAGICLLANVLVSDVFRIQPELQKNSVYAFYIASGIIFLTTLNQVFSAILQGIHRFDVYSKILNFNSIALLSGNIALALWGYGLLVLLAWNLVVLVIVCFLSLISAKSLLPEFGISFNFRRETLKKVLKFSSGVIGYQILGNLLLLFERGWITRKLGAENLTYYVVPMMLGLYIHSFASSLVLVIFPLASELTDQKEKLLRLYTKATKVISLLVVFLAATLIVQSTTFLTLWMGAEFAEKASALLIVHTVTFGLAAILTVSWQMTEGLGHPSFNFRMFTVSVSLSVILMITLTPGFGTYGVAVSRLAGFVILFLSIFYVEKWFFGKIQIGLWTKLIGVLGISVILSALVEEAIISNMKLSWFALIVSSFFGGIAYCLTAWLLGFITEDEKHLIRSVLRR